jgi:hypothetical protein
MLNSGKREKPAGVIVQETGLLHRRNNLGIEMRA